MMIMKMEMKGTIQIIMYMVAVWLCLIPKQRNTVFFALEHKQIGDVHVELGGRRSSKG